MPRSRNLDPIVGQGLTSDLLRSIAQIPGLPQTFLATLENLGCKGSGQLKPIDVANSDLVPQLIDILNADYGSPSTDHLGSSQRISKLRLLNACCCLLLPDIKSKQIGGLLNLLCRMLFISSCGDRQLRMEEQLCILQLLIVFVNRCSVAVKERLGEILGFLCVLSGLHRSSEQVSLIPTNLPHLQFTTPVQEGTRRESSCTDTSGSEFSDQDMSGDPALRRRRDEGLVEREALNALATIVRKCHKKEVVSYWYIFLPDKSFCPLKAGVTELLSHSTKKIRMLSINILVEFLNHCQQFLALAQHQEKGSSYTSLSTALAASLLELHKTLLQRVCEPLGNTEYVALLKLFAILGENSKYSRLTPGLLERLVNSLMLLAERERNPVIQVAVLSVFVALGHGPSITDLQDLASDLYSFVLPRSMPVPQTQVADNNVRYMALQALSVLTQIDIQLFVRNAPDVKSLIDTSLLDTDVSIVLHTFRFIKSFSKYLTEAVTQSVDPPTRLRNLTIAFWTDFLKPGNFELLERLTNANIRSAFSDCLAEIGPTIFSQLPEHKRIVCITYILGQCKTLMELTDSNVDIILQDRAALSSSLRTLGIFITFPCYLTDTAFHIDVADAVLPHLPIKPTDKKGGKNKNDPGNKTVRVSASWTLANLTDILVQAKQKMELTGEVDEFPLSLARNILLCGIACATDSSTAVNTKSNAVRCIGNMLNFIQPDKLQDSEYQDMMDGGTKAIIFNITNGKIMKIRWNACYASANVLKKVGVTEQSGQWVKDLVACLLDTVCNFQNFKVRINAAVSLGCVWSRSVLGSSYFPVLQGLLTSLESSQNVEVFGEWQHQSNLVDQLCLTICHLLSFLENHQEFSKFARLVGENRDIVENSFLNSAGRISPEKFGPVLQANTRISEFDARNEDEETLKNLLRNCAEK